MEKGIITNVKPEQINAASIDLTLGGKVLVEDGEHAGNRVVSLRARDKLPMKEQDITEFGVTMNPGDFVLAQTQQLFNLPNYISAEYKLKSSMARIGLEHLNAGWCDAGWHGSALTLELKNMTQEHFIHLQAGDAIGQIVFFTHDPVPEDRSYAARGRYNNDTSVSGVKP